MEKRSGIDRRSGYDRRVVHDLFYFDHDGVERRGNNDRRASNERREEWARITPWSSTRAQWPTPEYPDEELHHTYLKRILK